MSHWIKGSLLASFLLFTTQTCASAIANFLLAKKVDQDPTWSTLLHLVDTDPQIRDRGFLLSLEEFSVRKELTATIGLFESGSEKACQFPARRLFLERALQQSQYQLPAINCPDYKGYLKHVPVDNLYLVYTSENLTQPSSMMGHIMLKATGVNDNKLNVEHGISFFTELEGINVPGIIWDSLVTGKQGFFQIAPYAAKARHYREGEQRNVWEYKLGLTQWQKALIQAHFWELKYTQQDYYFHRYNCATVTQFILSIARPELKQGLKEWLTPIDVVKQVHESGLVAQTNVLLSNKWKVKMLLELLGESQVNQVYAYVEKGQHIQWSGYSAEQQFLMQRLAFAYNDLKYQLQQKSFEQWQTTNQQLISDQQRELVIELGEYKSPLLIPDDSQWSLAYNRRANKNWLSFRYLPASHRLDDDNRQYFSESELALSSFAIGLSPDTGDVKLEEWMLYSVKSLVPWDKFTRGISGSLRFGFEQHYDNKMDPSLAATIAGGLGMTYALHKDINVYAMLNVGLGFRDKAYLYTSPEVGFYIYELFNMKTAASIQWVDNQQNSSNTQKLVKLNQAFYSSQAFSLHLQYAKRWDQKFEEKSWLLEFRSTF